jgi:hydroxyacylglutathione hydrolase
MAMKTWITGSGCKIIRVLFGRSNVFMISGGTSRLLVDTGSSGDGKRLLKILGKTGKPDAVIMTHTHFDHAGNAGLLKERFSPAFIVQENEKEFLESGDSPLPKGTRPWTRFIYNLGAERKQHWFHVQGVKGDYAFKDSYDLSGFGINAFVLHTPGHSAGSSSIVVDNEYALAGDTLIGVIPGSAYPPWGDDPAGIILSWKKLLETGCHTFLPSHGLAISRQRVEKEYSRRSRHSGQSQ